MKNVLYIIAILVIPITGYCQEFEFLKKTDTIYLEFKGKEKQLGSFLANLNQAVQQNKK